MYRSVVTIMGLLVLTGFVVPSPSFAIHQSEQVTWQLVMISSYSACSNYHFQMTEKYNEITKEYFNLYQLDNKNYEPTCMTESQYDSEFQTSEDLDLLIIVFDRNKGRADLHSHDIGGFYSHVGGEWTHNHTIVFCDCSNFRFSNPSWILTHELSHFVLYYLDFDRSIVEDHIHELDAKFDYCIEVEHNDSCNDVKTRMDTRYSTVSVMTPYEPAIGKNLISGELEDEPILESTISQEMMRQITNWWVEGTIPDNEYENSLKKIFGYNIAPEDSEQKLVEAQLRNEINNKITKWWIEGKISDENYAEIMESRIAQEDNLNDDLVFTLEPSEVIFTDPPKSKKLDFSEHTFLAENAKEKSVEILNLEPFSENIEENLIENKNLPQWFKTRADWWINEKISTDEYVSGIKFILSN